MVEKKMDKGMQQRVSTYFNQLWSARSMFDEGEVMAQMPPSMSAEISTYIYGAFLRTIPLFRGLGNEIIFRLCLVVKPMICLKLQLIIEEGQPGIRTSSTLLSFRSLSLGFASDAISPSFVLFFLFFFPFSSSSLLCLLDMFECVTDRRPYAGTEMYLLMKGEVEVTKQGETFGFLSEVSFLPFFHPRRFHPEFVSNMYCPIYRQHHSIHDLTHRLVSIIIRLCTLNTRHSTVETTGLVLWRNPGAVGVKRAGLGDPFAYCPGCDRVRALLPHARFHP